MKITHAMVAELDGTVVRVMQQDNGMLLILFGHRRQPADVTEAEAEVLAKALPEFLKNPDQFKVEDGS